MAVAFTEKEIDVINEHDSPEKVQEFLNGLEYNFESDGVSTLRSFRRTVRDGVAHCMEGVLVAATILGEHGFPPVFLCMEAADIDHMIFPFKRDGKWGALAQSRDPNLKWRDPEYKTKAALVRSYRPYYYNYFTQDRDDLTLRGYAGVDLRRFGEEWKTGENDLWQIEDYLWDMKYRALFPKNGCRYFRSGRDGKITWLKK